MGGSTLYIGQYISFLKTANYKVYAICRKKDKGSDYLMSLGAKTIFVHFPFALNFSELDKYNDSLKKRIIDIVKFLGGLIISLFILLRYPAKIVIVGEFNLIPVLISSFLLKKRVICLIQTSISKSKWKQYLIYKLLKRAFRIIGITDIHTVDIPFKKKTKTIPNVFIEQSDKIKSHNPFDKFEFWGKKVIVFIGGISRIKGSVHFIKIALELMKLRNDLCFIILGNFHKDFQTKYAFGMDNADYNLSMQIFELIGDQIDKSFKFLGEIDYVNAVLKRSDLLISTSVYPHFSRPIVEAWATRVPVVAHEDLFTKHMENGNGCILFIEIEKYKESAIKINDLLNSNRDLTLMKNKGYNNYINNYTKGIFDDMLTEIFSKEI